MILAPAQASRARPKAGSFSELVDMLADLAPAGGPCPDQYAELNRCIRRLGDDIRAAVVEAGAVKKFVAEFTERHLLGSLQGAARAKKFGHSGDHEMIDDIYSLRLSADPKLRKWDMFFQAQAAPRAVRNRKACFHELLRSIPPSEDGSRLRVLNVGSGPGRDLREWFLSEPPARVLFDCVEMNAKAIEYASRLCRPFLQHIEFHHVNALRHVPSCGYDMVWSAGLFDYLSDRLFVRLLKALLPVVKPGGELVVGNFSEGNPSRDYMEIFGDWHLHHRGSEQLLALAEQAGAALGRVEVKWEPEGVNLFLHIRA